ncbi:MAG: hypothetical protein UT82_C0018G0018 [Parcubacteria group bacterium GW2011_GWB1_40_14]|nr:MAG: hypothetical protein UT82_C0018G0018 [Parcubacteria group bacterium GW2011_GWB1_40_14]
MDEIQVRNIIQQELERKFASLFKGDRFVFEKLIQIMDGRNIQLGLGTGTKIGTATNQKLGFFNVMPVVQQADIVALTDSLAGGSAGDIIETAIAGNDVLDSNFKRILGRINLLRTVLRNLGPMA